MSRNDALTIFIKTPVPFQVKTRLQPNLSGKESALLYSSFLRDLDERFIKIVDFDCWYAVSPENFRKEVLEDIVTLKRYFLQQGADIGERMSKAFEDLFSKGYTKVVLIGSDVPELPAESIDQALKHLDFYDCVIGPSADGGYYLIALKKRLPDLFRGINWSTSEVFNRSIDILKMNKTKYKVLDVKEDIDTKKELISLYHNLKDKNKKSTDFPVHTWEMLKNIYLKIDNNNSAFPSTTWERFETS